MPDLESQTDIWRGWSFPVGGSTPDRLKRRLEAPAPFNLGAGAVPRAAGLGGVGAKLPRGGAITPLQRRSRTRPTRPAMTAGNARQLITITRRQARLRARNAVAMRDDTVRVQLQTLRQQSSASAVIARCVADDVVRQKQAARNQRQCAALRRLPGIVIASIRNARRRHRVRRRVRRHRVRIRRRDWVRVWTWWHDRVRVRRNASGGVLTRRFGGVTLATQRPS